MSFIEFKFTLPCTCKEKYSMAKHGKGHALFWGRCKHRHGHKVLQITECGRGDILNLIVTRLNNGS